MSKTHELPTRGRPRVKGQATFRLANAVPPAQYDRMRAPAWTQSPAAPVRDGALDHQNIASRGYRC